MSDVRSDHRYGIIVSIKATAGELPPIFTPGSKPKKGTPLRSRLR